MTQSNKKTLLPEYRFLIIAVSAIIVALICSFCIVRITYIRGDSMSPTIEDGDWLVSVPLAYTFDEPERFDIVLMERKSLTSGQIIKRVIALPNETVEIKAGVIYIDGEAIEDEHYLPDENCNFGPITVEDGRYFVLGDNRKSSNDSRYWAEPTVSKKELRGKAIWIFPTEISDFFNS